MVIETKHKVTLWIPTILFVYLILGDFGTDHLGQMVYRVSTRGLVSSVLILGAASFITHGSRPSFILGIVLWALALAALLLEKSTLMVIHF